MTDLSTMSDERLIATLIRTNERCDRIMRKSAEGSKNAYGFGGALSLGWDWPTFSMIFPYAYSRRRRLIKEGLRRGLDKRKAA